jgi:transposase
MRHELTDEEWTAIRPMLPNKARGVPKAVLTVPKTDFRSSLNNGHQTSGRPLLKSVAWALLQLIQFPADPQEV